MTYAADILAYSPLAYYRLNETTSLVDSSGNARHGTFIGGTPTVVAGLVTGDSNQAVNFAASARGEVTSAAWMHSASFTIVATIKPTGVAASVQEIFSRYAGGASGTYASASFAFRLANNKLQAGIFNGTSTFGSVTGTTSLVAATTYDVAMTYNGTTGLITLYVNGLPNGTTTRTGMNTATTPLTIAYNSVSNPFTGVIDDVAYIGSELTAEQIGILSWSRRGSVPISAQVPGVLAEVMGTANPDARVPGITVEVLGAVPPVTAQVPSIAVEVLASTSLPPGPPSSVAVQPCGIGPLLTWNAPTSGGPVDEYEVRANGITTFTYTTNTFYPFYNWQWGLTSGLNYTYEVRAFGNGGYSPWVPVSMRAPFIYKQLFTASDTWVPPAHCTNATVLLVGGGGGGGNNANGGGGGGAGGVAFYYNIPASAGVGIPLVVGAGGGIQATLNVDGNRGQDTSFDTYVALGGGGGKGTTTPQTGFGSGGGGTPSGTLGDNPPGDVGTPPQGYAGGRGYGETVTNINRRAAGGGGGATTPGVDGGYNTGNSRPVGGNGGAGVNLGYLLGTGVGESGWFASGGAGGVRFNGAADQGIGPIGGGGNGGIGAIGTAPTAGQVNTGGGGGGGGGNAGGTQQNGQAGGSGFVAVFWYRLGISYVGTDTFVVPGNVSHVDVLVVGGGAGGGAGVPSIGTAVGGGGAGGYGWWPDYAVSPGSYTVTVGPGGPVGSAGGSSSFGALVRGGGGPGGASGGVGNPGASGGGGGSGGGSGVQRAGGAGTPGQGYDGAWGIGAATSPGRRGGGGGGGGGPAHDATQSDPVRGQGGPGVDSFMRVGYSLYSPDGWFAGGGTGGDQEGSVPTVPGGKGGGSSNNNHGEGDVGLPGSGGGGGGGADEGSSAGGRGVVAVLWDPEPAYGNAVIDMQTGYIVQVWDPTTLSWKQLTEEIGT